MCHRRGPFSITTKDHMTTDTPKRRPRKLKVDRGRLVYASQGDDRLSYSSWLSENETRTCDWKHCGRARHKMSRWCIQHARTYERTGHPVATAVRFGTWRPYLDQAEKFITQQEAAGHPGITAALQWCAEELFHQGPAILWANPKRPSTGYRVALNRCRKHGVEPHDLLARAISVELADDRGEAARPIFASDLHRIHQGAKLFLYHVPRPTKTSDPAMQTSTYQRVRWRVREYAHQRVNAAIGLLTLRAADEIKARLKAITPADPEPAVSGSSSPFLPST